MATNKDSTSTSLNDYSLDLENEVIEPTERGYYLEAFAKLDAYLDFMLDGILRKIHRNKCCNCLLDAVEKAMKKDYIYVSGRVKADIIKTLKNSNPEVAETKSLSQLFTKIKQFKEKRNKVLHSPLGHYNLVKIDKTNPKLSQEAENNAKQAIQLGIECYDELEYILLELNED